MNSLCRLCITSQSVTNYIFDDNSDLVKKMTYLPIQIKENDRLPHKICDKCLIKVDEVYQFCKSVVNVQTKLQTLLTLHIAFNTCETLVEDEGEKTDESVTDKDSQSSSSLHIKEESQPFSPLQTEAEDEELQGGSEDADSALHETVLDSEWDSSDEAPLSKFQTSSNIQKKNPVELPNNQNVIISVNKNTKQNLSQTHKRKRKRKRREEVDEKEYCCICGFKFMRIKKAFDHYCQHFKEPPPLLPSTGASHPCPRCNKMVERPNWSAHWLEKCQRSFPCSICNKKLQSPLAMMKHARGHLRPMKKFMCHICGAKYTVKYSLKIHIIRTHRKKITLLCNYCGRVFHDPTKLKEHIRVHTGEKPFGCDVCKKGFTKKRYLLEHERIHSGEKPFVCDCGKSFTQKGSLVIHRRSHTGERPYKCKWCKSKFVSQGLLNMHIKTKHL